jgi:hypothetical protein
MHPLRFRCLHRDGRRQICELSISVENEWSIRSIPSSVVPTTEHLKLAIIINRSSVRNPGSGIEVSIIRKDGKRESVGFSVISKTSGVYRIEVLGLSEADFDQSSGLEVCHGNDKVAIPFVSP